MSITHKILPLALVLISYLRITAAQQQNNWNWNQQAQHNWDSQINPQGGGPNSNFPTQQQQPALNNGNWGSNTASTTPIQNTENIPQETCLDTCQRVNRDDFQMGCNVLTLISQFNICRCNQYLSQL
jgi:hypothetical protein